MFEAHDKITHGMASIKDVKKLFDMLFGLVKDLKSQLEKQMSDKHDMSMNKCESMVNELNDTENRLKGVIKGIQQSTNTSLKGLKGLVDDEISRVVQLIPQVKDYASEMGYLEDLIKTVDKKMHTELHGEMIIEKINNLSTEQKYQIDKEHIKGLDEELKRIASIAESVTNNPAPRGIPRIPKWQQKNLTGTINSSNKVFTFEGSAFAKYSETVYLNYVSQNPFTDYNILGKTVTYIVAPDASLSGLPHIIRGAY